MTLDNGMKLRSSLTARDVRNHPGWPLPSANWPSHVDTGTCQLRQRERLGGVHGFAFTNAKGEKTAGKWIFEPVSGVQGLTDEEAKAKGPSFLFDDLRQRAAAGQVAFNFNLEIAQAGDRLNNATVPLPEGRKKLTLGQLKVTSVSPDAGGSCLTINFDPNRMPKGVEGLGDLK